MNLLNRLLSLSVLLFSCVIIAKEKEQTEYAAFKPLMDNVSAFCTINLQEKVYVQMDNTCFFQGDTIWFKAYTRQTGSEGLSTLSGTLYVDLLNHDGYIVRQRVLEIKDGEGIAFSDFPSDSTLFSGFYELRTYTRWQLNWGRDAPPHRAIDKDCFFIKRTARDFFATLSQLILNLRNQNYAL